MKPVIQQDPTGCAIASVAVLAGASYSDVRARAAALGIFADDRRLWSGTGYVRRLLGEYGLTATEDQRPFRCWDDLPDRALLAIKWHLERGRPFWHWVVFVRHGDASFVLDSKKGLQQNRRTDFGRMKPRWFIEVRGHAAKGVTRS